MNQRRPDTIRVLYVDDDHDYCELVEPSLEREHGSIEVVTETSASDGLDRISSESCSIDCIVSDHKMAKMTGLEFLEAVRDHHPDLPFILFTGKGSENVASEAISAGVTDYLSKYANDDIYTILANRIDNAVAQYHAERAHRESERRYRQLVEDSPHAVFVYQDEEIVYANDSMVELLKAEEQEQLYENDINELVNPSFRSTSAANATPILEAEEGDDWKKSTILRFDGEVRDVEVKNGFVEYDDESALQVVMRDITERKERERELRETKSQLEQREQQLTSLHHVTRDLIQATSKEEVAEIAVTAAEDVLDLPITEIYSVIGTEDKFHTLAQTSEVEELFDIPSQRLDEAAALEVVETGEETVRTDLDSWPGIDDAEPPIRSELLFPLGSHGVFAAGSTTRSEFNETELALATILAANTEAALDRTEREQAVTQLHETTENLLHAKTESDISQLIVDTAYVILNLSSVAIYLFDEDEGVLRPAATSPDVKELIGDPPTFTPGDSIAWDVFAEEKKAIYDDVREADDVYNPDTPVRSECLIPLGDHGVFIAGSTKEAAFTEEMIELAELLATNAEAALDRSQREQQVKEHEQQLQERTTQLRRLNQLNELLRDVNQALVRAETRDEIEHTICERLVEQQFAFAWVATPDQASDQLVPQAWAGTEGSYLDRISTKMIDADHQEPAVKAAQTEDITVVDNISQDFRNEEWRKEALTHEFRSVASIPLVYDDVFFGVLSIYTKQPGTFDDIPTAVLCELGETIGYAINSVERKQTLLTDPTVELEFEITDPDCLALQLARQSDCSLTFESVIPQADNAALAFVTVREGSPDRVLELEEDSVLVDHARLVGEDDDTQRVELLLSTLPVEAKLLNHGAVLKHSTADSATARVVIDVPTSTNVQSIMEFVSSTHSEVELIARRDHEYSESETSDPSGLVDQLTERQREVMQAAHYAGYFKWPRDSTAEELAESLDVSSATVHHHLRAVQRKLMASMIDNGR